MYMEGQNRIWLAIQTNLSSLQVVEKLGCTDVTRILEDCEIKTKALPENIFLVLGKYNTKVV